MAINLAAESNTPREATDAKFKYESYVRVDWFDPDQGPMCTVWENDAGAQQQIKDLLANPYISLKYKACIRYTDHYHLVPSD